MCQPTSTGIRHVSFQDPGSSKFPCANFPAPHKDSLRQGSVERKLKCRRHLVCHERIHSQWKDGSQQSGRTARKAPDQVSLRSDEMCRSSSKKTSGLLRNRSSDAKTGAFGMFCTSHTQASRSHPSDRRHGGREGFRQLSE